MACHAAGLGPESPREAESGQALVPAVVGQCVAERISGGVIALPSTTEDAGEAGVQHERGQVMAAGVLVEQECATRLGCQYASQLSGGEFGDGGVVEDGGGVEDGRQWVLGRNGVQQGGYNLG